MFIKMLVCVLEFFLERKKKRKRDLQMFGNLKGNLFMLIEKIGKKDC